MKVSVITLCLLVCVGCASKLEAGKVDTVEITGKFTNTLLADDVTETVVDATIDTEWQRFDFDTAAAVEEGWDLSFCRFRMVSNGGAGGDAGVELAALEGQSFDELKLAPSEGFAQDSDDGDDGNMDPDNVLNSKEHSWYNYNLDTHELTPHEATYVVHSSEDRYYKLAFEKYYDDAGTPAWLTFKWAEISAPK
jgi:HmuY protein